VLITKDEDFADLIPLSDSAHAVIWIRTGNTTRRALLAWFEPLLDQITTMVDAGDRLIELREDR
jgi:predicted nuclease of predicted toxin-antitoxin system